MGEARDLCEKGQSGGADKAPLTDPTASLDPLTSLSRGFADAAITTLDYLSKAVKETADVDFTNMEFSAATPSSSPPPPSSPSSSGSSPSPSAPSAASPHHRSSPKPSASSG